jgi:glucose/arabinose dehydrogenase
LEIPWGLEFLPNGDLLIAERNGTLSRFTSDKKLIKIEGLPEIRVAGQGGLLDIKMHPDYAKNGFIYIAYSYYGDAEKNTGNTAIIRTKLKDNNLTDITPIYKGTPAVKASHHYGCKLEFDRANRLYFSIGDRGNHDVFPQTLNNSNGKIHRLNDDGTVPADNPFVSTENAEPSVYSYGHRNSQGIAMHPVTGEIWESEHGPRGGDEINLLKKGKNYGWPVISFGINYNGTILTPDTANTGMEQPITYYIPSIAPCGMTFLTGNKYKGWENSLLIGSLRFEYLERCVIENHKVVKHERLLEGIGRVRNVKVSPDGYIYVGVENPGRILKLIPVDE